MLNVRCPLLGKGEAEQAPPYSVEERKEARGRRNRVQNRRRGCRQPARASPDAAAACSGAVAGDSMLQPQWRGCRPGVKAAITSLQAWSGQRAPRRNGRRRPPAAGDRRTPVAATGNGPAASRGGDGPGLPVHYGGGGLPSPGAWREQRVGDWGQRAQGPLIWRASLRKRSHLRWNWARDGDRNGLLRAAGGVASDSFSTAWIGRMSQLDMPWACHPI